MISGTIALAFTAGMVAAFNPCGFSLLLAYIGAFVAGDEIRERRDRRVVRAITVSIGFVVVFATVGLVIDRVASEARRQLLWVTIVMGSDEDLREILGHLADQVGRERRTGGVTPIGARPSQNRLN